MDAISITIVVILIVVIVYCTKIYNNLVSLKHAVSKAWVNIESALKQRHDQLPELIEKCKEYGIEQSEIFDTILKARTQIMNAQQMGEVQSLAAAEQNLQAVTANLLDVANQNTELSGDENFQVLSKQIRNIELAILDRSDVYNECVNTSNNRIEQFPDSFIASFFSFAKYDLLEINGENNLITDPAE